MEANVILSVPGFDFQVSGLLVWNAMVVLELFKQDYLALNAEPTIYHLCDLGQVIYPLCTEASYVIKSIV